MSRRLRKGFESVLLAACVFTVMAWAQDDIGGMLAQADRQFAQGRMEAACAAYERALQAGARLDADYLHSHNLGRCYLSSSRPDLPQAARWLENAQRLNPAAEDTRLLLARAQTALGALDSAAANYRILADAHPSNTDYVLPLAEALRQAGKTEAALDYLHSDLLRFPSLNGVRLEYARLLAYQRQFVEAKRQYEVVLQADPDGLAAQVGLAKVISWQGDQEEALRRYDRILQRAPGLYDALVGRAFSLLWMGRQDEARAVLVQASRRHPEDREVAEALRSLGVDPVEPPSAPPPPSVSVAQPMTAQDPAPAQPRAVPALKHGTALSRPTTPRQPRPAETSETTPTPRTAPQTATPSAVPSPALPLLPQGAALAAAGIVIFLVVRRTVWRSRRHRKAMPRIPRAVSAPVSLSSTVALTPADAVGRASTAASEAPAVSMPALAPLPPPVATAVEKRLPQVEEGMTAANALTGARVVIVGKEEAVVGVELRALAAANCEVTTFAAWQEALDWLDQNPADLLLLNTILADGWTAMTAYLWLGVNRPELQPRTLLALTVPDADWEQSRATSSAQCIYHPFQISELVAAARSLLEKTRSNGQAEACRMWEGPADSQVRQWESAERTPAPPR